MARRWDAILDGGAIKSFADTSLFPAKKRVELVTSWEMAENQIESWGMFYHVLLVDADIHPTTYEICNLIKENSYARERIWAQIHRQTKFPVGLLCLLQTEFNESFRQALEQ